MNAEDQLRDFTHLYHHFLKNLTIRTLMCGSLREEDAFPRFLERVAATKLVRCGESELPIEFIYEPDTAEEDLRRYSPSVLFTKKEQRIEGYVSIPITHNLFATMRGRLDISYLPLVSHFYNFNASVVCHKEGRFTTIRTDEDVWYGVRSSITKFRESDFELIKNGHRALSLSSGPVCREDVRLWIYKGDLYGSYTRIHPYITGIKTNMALAVGKFDPTGKLVGECVIPYGGNLTNEPEKSWTFWEGPNGQLHCVYTFTPLRILDVSAFNKTPTDITLSTALPDTIRGGAPGVVYDGKVWCFTHVHKNGGTNTGVVVLSHSDIPTVLGYCNTLIEAKDYKNLFFYICGAYLDVPTRCWKLTGGAHDTLCCVITLPFDDVVAKIQWF